MILSLQVYLFRTYLRFLGQISLLEACLGICRTIRSILVFKLLKLVAFGDLHTFGLFFRIHPARR